MSSEPGFNLGRLKTRYVLLRSVEILLLTMATILLTKAVAGLVVQESIYLYAISILAGIVVGIIRGVHYHLFSLNTGFFISYLNKNYPQLKESADLLLSNDSELTGLQRLQKVQTQQQFHQLYPEIKLPNHIAQAFGIFAACGVIYILLSSFAAAPGEKVLVKEKTIEAEKESIVNDTTTADLRSLSISITPPSYTQVKSFVAHGSNISFPEGSKVTWQAIFTNDVTAASIIFSGNDSTDLVKTSDRYSISRSMTESGFYQLQWRYKNKTHRSDYFRIEVIKDEPPKVSITNLEQFTKLRFTDNLKVGVNSSLSDDYGLTDGHIIATVSKGSGESVKFREEKLLFTNPQRINGKNVQASLTLDLLKLGLEPGDELYFYVQAFDNKVPEANHHRTETFFIALQDTTQEIAMMDDGLGVDLLPEYFRSQRQIIIDTEKLLKDRKKISKQEFNSTSNELGYDQKALRLRYGQFMGEEADSGIGTEAAAEAVEESEHEGEEKDKDVMKQYGHQHDTENEHNLVEPKKEDPMKAFMHQHDNSEEATFLFQSVKAKLKAALAIMWDAELHLRLFDPAKSLPYQYKALNLLKEISNDSRVYVHRSGFDPPPLKEEKRLTADLTEVRTNTNRYASDVKIKYPAIRQALIMTEKLLQGNATILSEEQKNRFMAAGQELAMEAIEQPSYLGTLTLLKSLVDDKVKAENMSKTLLQVRKTLWRAIPASSASPAGIQNPMHMLDEKFLKSLETIKNE
ncbi:MAG: hypothetical protein HOP08_03365 [Cyclobacteriaceae bacterium]|nr:hypothetical protein [Cyclobacteriaceae bacterium]